MGVKGLRIAAIAAAGALSLLGCRDRDEDLDRDYRRTPADQSCTPVTPAPVTPSTPSSPTTPPDQGTGGSGRIEEDQSQTRDTDQSDMEKIDRERQQEDLPQQRVP